MIIYEEKLEDYIKQCRPPKTVSMLIQITPE
jgi:hypothetical protein